MEIPDERLPIEELLWSTFEKLIERGRLEWFGHFLVETGNYLVDCLLPRLFLVSLVIDCIKEVSQSFLNHVSENIGKLPVIVADCLGFCLRLFAFSVFRIQEWEGRQFPVRLLSSGR